MGFNKRYVGTDNLNSAIKNGIDYLISYIKKPDCLITMDKYSECVCDIILNNSDKDVIISELKKINFI